MESEAIARLQTKEAGKPSSNVSSAIFGWRRWWRTLLEQLRRYDEDYYPQRRENGQLTYLAVSKASPAGQKLTACQRVAVKLTLHSPDDLIALGTGVAALRQQRLLRLTEEAEAQGGLLSHEDLACLLCSSLATIKRDVHELRQQDLRVDPRPSQRHRQGASVTRCRSSVIISPVTPSARSSVGGITASAPFGAIATTSCASSACRRSTWIAPPSGAPPGCLNA
ncbi:MAG: DUF1670 domain-containing protein [Anaerolineae bacterium]|nr:DUF1670 domain-containing protein [Anaerolineae bacterium]